MIEGYIKLYRRLTEWEWFDNPNMVATWIHILLLANWRDGQKWHGEPLGRGELITSLPKLSASIGLTEKQIRTCLERLEKSGEIKKSRADKWTRITVCKFGDYQATDEAAGQDEGGMRADKGQDEGRQRAASKEGKKEKEKDIKKKKDEAIERLYQQYPASIVRVDGNRVALRSTKDKEKLARLLDSHTEDELSATIKNYLASNPGAYTKMLSTFLNNLPDFGNQGVGALFSGKKWGVEGELYSNDEVRENLTQSEISHFPIEIKRQLINGGMVTFRNGKIALPDSHD